MKLNSMVMFGGVEISNPATKRVDILVAAQGAY